MGAVLRGLKSPMYKPNMNSNEHENISRSQGAKGDRGSERRLCKTREPMDKNLIKGRRDEVSWHNTAKPFGLAAEVNEAVVRGRTAFLPGEISGARAPEKSAEVVVVSSRPGAGRCPSKL
jgi:hypothetical protein